MSDTKSYNLLFYLQNLKFQMKRQNDNEIILDLFWLVNTQYIPHGYLFPVNFVFCSFSIIKFLKSNTNLFSVLFLNLSFDLRISQFLFF
jgi:hypothetical protein